MAFDCKAGGKTALSVGETAGSLRLAGHGGGHLAVVGCLQSGRTPRGHGTAGVNRQAVHAGHVIPFQTADGLAARRLTPREWERLQGFPDDYTRIPWRGRKAEHCPDGPRYHVLGNSFPVPVVRWIGRRIGEADALKAA